VTDCPTPAIGNICLKPNGNSIVSSYTVNNAVNPKTFDLNISNGTVVYHVTNDTLPTAVIPSASKWVQFAAGNYHTCGLTSENKIYCWGRGTDGQLGNNSTSNSLTPVAVDTSGVLSGKTIVSMVAGSHHTVVLDSNGKIYTWGKNMYGQLGINSTTASSSPVAVIANGALNGKTITSIVAGYGMTYAIDSVGQAYGWGYGWAGALGNNSTSDSLVPSAVYTSGVLSGKVITSLATGSEFGLALCTDGKVYAWGRNNVGQSGDNSTTQSTIPVATVMTGVLSGKTITSILAGSSSSLAIDSAGKMYSWGYNANGTLGDNSTTNSSIPVAVVSTGALSGKVIISAKANNYVVVALDNAGKLYSWGGNTYGQLGNNSTTQSTVPIVVPTTGVLSGKTITKVAVSDHVVVLDSDGQGYAWGFNNAGQLGNSLTTNSLVPITIAAP
jgi:alpha-tubulin suppressor-like RCC1 family protein